MEGDSFDAVANTVLDLQAELNSLTDEEIAFQSEVIQKEDWSEWFDDFKKKWIDALTVVAQRLAGLSSAEHRREVDWPRTFNRVGFVSQIQKNNPQLDMPFVVVQTVKDLLEELNKITIALWQKSGGVDCAVCGILSRSVCDGCSRVRYCSTQCQKEDWIAHRRVCSKTGLKVETL